MDNELLQPVTDTDLLSPTHSGRSSSTREKLSDMFNASDFVRVINPDTEAYVWQFLPEAKERIEFDTSSSTVPQKITYRDNPEIYKLEPGQSAVLIGANAYVMIDGLVKRMMSKTTIARNPNVKPGEARNFNFSDDAAQLRWINEIFLGKATPGVMPIDKPKPVTVDLDQIDKDLGVGNDFSPVRRQGRPRKATA